MAGETRNSRVLASFVAYCEANPDQRFWQALTNWARYGHILVTDQVLVERVPPFRALGPVEDYRDPYHWEGRRHDEPRGGG